jgi:hypothetical protein
MALFGPQLVQLDPNFREGPSDRIPVHSSAYLTTRWQSRKRSDHSFALLNLRPLVWCYHNRVTPMRASPSRMARSRNSVANDYPVAYWLLVVRFRPCKIALVGGALENLPYKVHGTVALGSATVV